MTLTLEQELELITSTASIAKSTERIVERLERLEAANYRRAERMVEIVGDMSRRFDACMEQLRKDVTDIRHQLYPIARDMERVQSDVEKSGLTPVLGVPITSSAISLLTPPGGLPIYNPPPPPTPPAKVENSGSGIDLKLHVNWGTVWSVGKWLLAALGGGASVWLAKVLHLL